MSSFEKYNNSTETIKRVNNAKYLDFILCYSLGSFIFLPFQSVYSQQQLHKWDPERIEYMHALLSLRERPSTQFFRF